VTWFLFVIGPLFALHFLVPYVCTVSSVVHAAALTVLAEINAKSCYNNSKNNISSHVCLLIYYVYSLSTSLLYLVNIVLCETTEHSIHHVMCFFRTQTEYRPSSVIGYDTRIINFELLSILNLCESCVTIMRRQRTLDLWFAIVNGTLFFLFLIEV